MKIQDLAIILIIFLHAVSCSSPNENPSERIFNIDADNTKNLIDLKLSNLADSFRLVQLETTRESMLDDVTDYYIGEEYILAYSKKGVYKFNPDGKFIKKLFGLGRGPNEFLVLVEACIFVVDERKNLLYIYDQYRRGKYFVYDLIKEEFKDPIKQLYPGFGSFDIFNDSLIIASLYSYEDKSEYTVYFQDLKGNFVSGIKNNKKVIFKESVVTHPGWLVKAGSKYYYRFHYDDTLFQIKENRIIPYLVLNFNSPRENPPDVKRKKGDRIIFFQIGDPSFTIIQIQIVEDIIMLSANYGNEQKSCYYVLLDNSTGQATKINSYIDNFIGDTLDNSSLSEVFELDPFFFKISPSNKLVVEYYPSQIKEAVEENLKYEEFPEMIKQELFKINETIKETDNPVLLIGKIKCQLLTKTEINGC